MAKQLSKPELKRRVRNARYKRQAKKIRATNAFGDLFRPSEGVDLRSPDSWTPAVKARVTRYAKELGPLIAGTTKTKRYFRPDHLAQAIEVSPQEKTLPGQRAAIFPVDDIEEKVEIEFSRKHRIRKVVRGGIEEQKLNFNMNALIRDPVAELERVLEQAPGQFFKFVTGANESDNVYNAPDMIVALERMIERYEEMDDKDVDDFLYGIKAYPGMRSPKSLRKRTEKHKAQVTKRQRARLVTLAKQKRAYTKAEMRGIRATGRRGRLK